LRAKDSPTLCRLDPMVNTFVQTRDLYLY